MRVSGFSLDLHWFLQFIVTAFFVALGLLQLVKNTASKYFVVDANFESSTFPAASSPDGDGRSDRKKMPGVIGTGDACAVCGSLTKKQCSGCKMVKYCSEECQKSHWYSGHNRKCKDFKLSGKINSNQSASVLRGRKASTVPLVPASGTSEFLSQSEKILFPYEEFVELFNWDKPGFPPCGLLNCGNSCFANVVLQCLTYTRPLVAYLLEKGHKKECRRNDWCFLCEFQIHVERASKSLHPFSPINILSRLPNIGGNLGYGKQEDAHELMRFAIDTMQSVCLDEFGGEKAVHPRSQETTLVQHIFGGHLQSEVICTKCNNVSNQFENMMDLTVEIQGDAESLEECLDQFTARECLHGDNMYKCDGCNDYVLAWKRLTVRQAPNILTIALKRFQSGRFGKLNKRVAVPETLDLSPYMSEAEDGNDVYKLYAVVVHVDMLNASFFGHYICYTKDFRGNWYRIDDCKVTRAESDEVLSQGAYMLLYSRVRARPSCLNPIEPYPKQPAECSATEAVNTTGISGSLPSHSSSQEVSSCEEELSSIAKTEVMGEDLDLDPEATSSVSKNVKDCRDQCTTVAEKTSASVEHADTVVSGFTSLTNTHSAEAYVLNRESPTPIYNIETGNAVDVSGIKECVSIDSLTRGSVSTKYNVCENGEISHDISIATIISAEGLNETSSVNSRVEPEKVKSGVGLPSSGGTENAVGKLDGRNSSGAKLKPLFPPGFLGKRPRNNSTRQDGKAPAENGKFSPACDPNSRCNGFSKPGLSHQNSGQMRDEEKPYLEYNSSSSSFLEKQAGQSWNQDQMVTSESGEHVSLCNGYSGGPIVSDGSIVNGIRDEKPFVIDQPFSHDGELHGHTGMAPSRKMETMSE